MKVVIAGASGFLGTALRRALVAAGDDVRVLVRHEPRSRTEIAWNPVSHELDPSLIADTDAVICLSGAGIESQRWTAGYKRELRRSRIDTTSTIAHTLAGMAAADPSGGAHPSVLLNASAIGFYGDRGDDVLDERDGPGDGFLSDLVADWEAATRPAAAAGVRVAVLRTGLVLAASGGLLKRLIPFYKAGIGGKLASGRQYQSWISLTDELSAIRHILHSDAISGPVNLTGPDPVRNSEFSRQLGQVLHRPSLFPAPAFGVRIVLGEFANEGALASQRVLPNVLLEDGFTFAHKDIRSALQWAVEH